MDYSEMIKAQPNDKCRYIFVSYQFLADDKRKLVKTVLLLWTPSSSKAKEKVVYCSTKNALLKEFTGVQIEIQIDSHDEASEDKLREKILTSES